MTEIDKSFSEWSDNQKLAFLESLSVNLTVAVRTVWSEEGISAEKKLNQIKWINELHHRIPSRARSVRLKEAEWSGPDAGLNLEHWIAQEPTIRSLIEGAVRLSIGTVESSKPQPAAGALRHRNGEAQR